MDKGEDGTRDDGRGTMVDDGMSDTEVAQPLQRPAKFGTKVTTSCVTATLAANQVHVITEVAKLSSRWHHSTT